MLPIGSIIYLNEGTSKVMILNRGPIIEVDGEKRIFDYSGCMYPQGFSPENVYYFNDNNIDEVVFEGFSNSEEERFMKLYSDWKVNNEGEIKQGEVTGPIK